MKTIPLIYQGPLPIVQIEISQGIILEAARHGAPVLVSETLAAELLARGDFIEATQSRADPHQSDPAHPSDSPQH